MNFGLSVREGAVVSTTSTEVPALSRGAVLDEEPRPGLVIAILGRVFIVAAPGSDCQPDDPHVAGHAPAVHERSGLHDIGKGWHAEPRCAMRRQDTAEASGRAAPISSESGRASGSVCPPSGWISSGVIDTLPPFVSCPSPLCRGATRQRLPRTLSTQRAAVPAEARAQEYWPSRGKRLMLRYRPAICTSQGDDSRATGCP
jgi:hypothetical protein